MTLAQIKKLLDRVEEAAAQVSDDIEQATDIAASQAALHELAQQARTLASRAQKIVDLLREKSDECTTAADSAETLVGDLEAIADQLEGFED